MTDVTEDEADRSAPVSRTIIEALYRHESGRLVRFFSRRIRRQADAQDLVQDAFVSLAGARIDGDPLPYLQRIARNLLVSRQRHDARWGRLVADTPFEDESHLALQPQQTLEIEAEDVKRQYQRVIDTLPEKTRRIYLMHRLGGLTYNEIATEMGVHVKTVEYHIASALKSLVRGMDQI